MAQVDIEGRALTRLTDIGQLLLDAALYAELQVSADEAKLMAQLRFGQFKLDTYCIGCRSTATFSSDHVSYSPNDKIKESYTRGYFTRSIECARQKHHQYHYWFYRGAATIEKVGQHPSVEDIHGADLRRFDGVLEQVDSKELRTAGGLYSHGIGIGAFVYIRRIFERMIERHREQSDSEFSDWARMRVEDRIAALSAVLPPALVKHRQIYSILSKGIHELSEDECKRYFPVMKRGIIAILEQDLEARIRKQADDDLESEVQGILRELNAPKKSGG